MQIASIIERTFSICLTLIPKPHTNGSILKKNYFLINKSVPDLIAFFDLCPAAGSFCDLLYKTIIPGYRHKKLELHFIGIGTVQDRNSLLAKNILDLSNAGIYSGYDDYVRGWIGGTGKEFSSGIIHFAPNVDDRNTELYNRAFDTLEMFAQNGAEAKTIVRALGKRWEQPLFSILTNMELKPSIHEQLKEKAAVSEPPKKQPSKEKEAEI